MKDDIIAAILALIITILVGVALFAIEGAINNTIYGDWTCAYKKCVVVKEKEMKIRDKKTGAIYSIGDIDLSNNQDGIWLGLTKYTSLAELNNDWEDVEEPKEYWCINEFGTPEMVVRFNRENIYDKSRKLIGNDFDTKEEAEQAIEKLKALEILNNNGFRIIDWELDFNSVADGKIWFDIGLNTQWDAEQLLERKPEIKEALNLLFFGKDD